MFGILRCSASTLAIFIRGMCVEGCSTPTGVKFDRCKVRKNQEAENETRWCGTTQVVCVAAGVVVRSVYLCHADRLMMA